MARSRCNSLGLVAGLVLASVGSLSAATLSVYQEEADLIFHWDGGIDVLERSEAPEGPFSPVSGPRAPPLTLVNEAAILGLDFYYRLASGSNMAFRLEWRFPASGAAVGRSLFSLPLVSGLTDIAVTAAPGEPDELGEACDSGGDGVVNADDALCRFWSDRNDTGDGAYFNLQRYEQGSCRSIGRTGYRVVSGGGELRIGAWVESIHSPDVAGTGYFAYVGVDELAPEVENATVFVGSHDPSHPGRLVAAGGCSRDVIGLPYHALYETVDEILCGREGIDWIDADFDGAPDSCEAGIHDPVSGAAITVARIDSDPASRTLGVYQARTAFVAAGVLRFAGTDFELRAGEAFLVSVSLGYEPRPFLPPHH